MTAPTNVYAIVDHVDRSGSLEWDCEWEEILGGSGRSTMSVQDRTNSLEESDFTRKDIQLKISDPGGPLDLYPLYRGEVVSATIELPPGKPFRVWKLECADYNGDLPNRLVGALDGKTWLDVAGLGIYVNIDPAASSLKTDKLTVQALFDNYFRVDGQAAETATFVNEYLTDFIMLNWYYSDMQQALEALAAFVVQNLQFWLDPALFFHWVTIPAWQDLAQDSVAAYLNDAEAQSALMLDEAPVDGLQLAPYEVSDIDAGGAIGFRSLKIAFDGSSMPEQVYVRGGTGYVYNAPPIPAELETKTVVSSPVSGSEGTYELTIVNNDTKLWHVDSTGYVSVTYALAAAGGPWPVKWVSVPWNVARHKGGNYWKFLSGPHIGLLADDHTNYLANYGKILVELVTTTTAQQQPPTIGIGGSGWTGEATQDPNKRQAYLEAPISTTRALRDAFGGQALYRGSTPTLRGSFVVSGYDGWRAGQLVKITDARLPASLNGLFFMIQSVNGKLMEGRTEREYTIGFGDGPTSRYSYRPSSLGAAQFPPPVDELVIDVYDLSPGPNSSQTITAQLVNGSGQPWAIAGKVVEWSLQCYNALGALIAEGTLNPTVSITDDTGKARTTFKSGADVNLVYFVFAAVRAT